METKIFFKIFLSFFALLLGNFLFLSTAQASPLPTGFVKETFINGLGGPTTLDFAPDGRVFVLEIGGKIRVYKNNTLLSSPLAQVPALVNSDRGALGLALDPDWSNSPYVYVYFIDSTDGKHKVWRFSAQSDTDPLSGVEIYNSGRVAGTIHAGGGLHFGPDGKLYLSIGDGGGTHEAQELPSPLGKILRMNKDGSAPSDNPFFNTPGAEKRVWAYGFRNPFRFQFDSVTGKMYEGDVGDLATEEINIVEAGKNYGWPRAEGKCTLNCAGLTDPIFQYNHILIDNHGTGAIVGGFVYRGSNFPSDYQGKYFFADFTQNFLRSLSLNDNNGVITAGPAVNFDDTVLNLVDLKEGPDGAIYLVPINSGVIQRIRYNVVNKNPIAVSSADVKQGGNPLTVHFSSTGSSDPEGKPLAYTWNFGDGTTSTDPNPTKIFSDKGQYSVVLTVSDGVNTSQATPLTIQVSTPPTLTITLPVVGVKYKDGDTITYNSDAIDANGNALPPSAFTTEIRFHHNVHFHPFLAPTQSKSGQFTIPVTGEEAADVWFRIIVTAKDALGLSTTKSVDIFPFTSNNQILTNPPGLVVNVDSQPKTTPFIFTGVVGFERILEAPTQTVNGKTYEFDRWSDLGTQSHTIKTPDTDTVYTAFFKEKIVDGFRAQFFPNTNLSGSPVLERVDSSINFDWGAGSPDTKVSNDFFSARWIKSQSFQAGRYVFTTFTDDGSRLYIDGNKVVDDWSDHAARSKSGTVDLTEGTHEVKLEYYEAGGGAVAKLSWSLDKNQPQKIVNIVNVELGTFANSTIINGHSILGGGMKYGLNIPIVVGSPIIVTGDDYCDHGDSFSCHIVDSWTPMVAPSQDFNLKVLYRDKRFYKTTVYPNIDLAGVGFENQYLITGTYNFDIQDGVPDFLTPPRAGPDNFSLRSKNIINFDPAGKYEFLLKADGGVRLFVDGDKIIDNWEDTNSVVANIGNKFLTKGEHEIVVEYFDLTGNASASLSWLKMTDLPPVTTFQYWKGEYFDNIALQGAPKLIRDDVNLAFQWNQFSADPTLPADNFSARWTRTLPFDAATYSFRVEADDGVRVFIDDQNVLDKWKDQSTVYTFDKQLSAGDHVVRVEYFEHGGHAKMYFSYTKGVDTVVVSPPPAPTVGFTAEYFDNQFLQGTSKLTKQEPKISFNWDRFSPSVLIPNDHFSAKFTGVQKFDARSYTFNLGGDDGIRLYIDGEKVIDGWKDQSVKFYQATKTMTAGNHEVKVEYYENGGSAEVYLNIQ